MGQSECVPQHDVSVGDVFRRVSCDPGWQTLRWLAGCLGHVPAGWVDLGVIICGRSVVDQARNQGKTYIS
jgi:hypothetical protein